MKPQNREERTRTILQFAGLFALATLLAGSSFYFPMQADGQSYQQLKMEFDSLQFKVDQEKKLVQQFEVYNTSLQKTLKKVDSLNKELEKVNPKDGQISLVELTEGIKTTIGKATLSKIEAEQFLAKNQLSNGVFYQKLTTFYGEAFNDKEKLARYMERIKSGPSQDIIDKQEMKITQLQMENSTLRDKIASAPKAGGAVEAGGVKKPAESKVVAELNTQITKYQNNITQIQGYGEEINTLIKKVEQNKREVTIGSYYRIANIHTFNDDVLKIKNTSEKIKILAAY